MKLKNLLILCAVFLLLMGLVLLKQGRKPKVVVSDEGKTIVSTPIDLNTEDEVLLRFGDVSVPIHFQKKNNQWLVTSFHQVPVDKVRLQGLVDQLNRLEGEIRSDNAALLPDYGIADKEGIHVIFKNGGTEAFHFVIGAKRAGPTDDFIRSGNDNKVYIVHENLLAQFGLWGEVKAGNFKTDLWLDKRVISLEEKDVQGIRVAQTTKGQERVWMELTRKEVDGNKKWSSTVEYPFGLSATKIKSYVNSFANLRASQVVPLQEADTAFNEDLWQAKFTLEGGGTVTLLRGKKDKNGYNYYVKLDGKDYCFKVPVATFDNFVKGTGDIFVTNPLKIEDGKVVSVDVQDIPGHKKFTATKVAEDQVQSQEASAPQKFVWNTPAGKTVETKSVEDMIRNFKSMNLTLAPVEQIPPKDMLLIRWRQEGNTTAQAYRISAKATALSGQECHFLKVDNDPNGYCYTEKAITGFQKTIPSSE